MILHRYLVVAGWMAALPTCTYIYRRTGRFLGHSNPETTSLLCDIETESLKHGHVTYRVGREQQRPMVKELQQQTHPATRTRQRCPKDALNTEITAGFGASLCWGRIAAHATRRYAAAPPRCAGKRGCAAPPKVCANHAAGGRLLCLAACSKGTTKKPPQTQNPPLSLRCLSPLSPTVRAQTDPRQLQLQLQLPFLSPGRPP